MMLCLLQSEDGEWYSTVLPKSKRMKASRSLRCSPGIGAPRIEIPCGRVTDTWTLPHSWAHMSEALLAGGSTVIARCST
jgi:hypothetical protein